MNSGDLKTYKSIKISKSNFFTITILSLHSICSESKKQLSREQNSTEKSDYKKLDSMPPENRCEQLKNTGCGLRMICRISDRADNPVYEWNCRTLGRTCRINMRRNVCMQGAIKKIYVVTKHLACKHHRKFCKDLLQHWLKLLYLNLKAEVACASNMCFRELQICVFKNNLTDCINLPCDFRLNLYLFNKYNQFEKKNG